MFYLLSFLLSWLSGMLAILVSAFFIYDHFSIIDITIFAVFTFAGFLILFFAIYLATLKVISKKLIHKQALLYPLLFSVLANSPVYFITWINAPGLYGPGEALLFTIAFVTIGLVFGSIWVWRNPVAKQQKKDYEVV